MVSERRCMELEITKNVVAALERGGSGTWSSAMPRCFGVASSWRTTDAGTQVPQPRGDGGFPLARAGRSRAVARDRPRLAVRGRELPAPVSSRRLSAPLDRGGEAAAGNLG